MQNNEKNTSISPDSYDDSVCMITDTSIEQNRGWFYPVQIYFWNSLDNQAARENFLSLFLLPILFPYKYRPKALGGTKEEKEVSKANANMLLEFYQYRAQTCTSKTARIDAKDQTTERILEVFSSDDDQNVPPLRSYDMFFSKRFVQFAKEHIRDPSFTLLNTNSDTQEDPETVSYPYLDRIDKLRNTRAGYPNSKTFLNGYFHDNTEKSLSKAEKTYAEILKYLFKEDENNLFLHSQALYKELTERLQEKKRRIRLTDEECALLESDNQEKNAPLLSDLPAIAAKLLTRAFLFYALEDYREEKNKKKTQYALKDHMFSFWYRFIPKAVSVIEMGQGQIYYEKVVKPQLHSFMGSEFWALTMLLSEPENCSISTEKVGEAIELLLSKPNEIQIPSAQYRNFLSIIKEKLFSYMRKDNSTHDSLVSVYTRLLNRINEK